MSGLDTGLRGLKRVAIVGTGLLGGSLGLALRQRGFAGHILGVGRRQATLDRARQHGCIDETTTDPGQAARDSDLIVLATPLGSFGRILGEIAPHAAPGLVLTDVGSTKALVCADARRLLPPALARRFIGAHPMAGKELHGPEHASPDLFVNAPCVITAEPDADAQALTLVESLWSAVGMRLIRMSPQMHDQCVARISHLPHALAVLLVELAMSQGGLEVASTGFRDTTRVASGDPEVWSDIFTTNRGACLEVIDAFTARLGQFRQLLDQQDTPALMDLLRRAKTGRDAWIAKANHCDTGKR
jgi:prephenate dehydrogenase